MSKLVSRANSISIPMHEGGAMSVAPLLGPGGMGAPIAEESGGEEEGSEPRPTPSPQLAAAAAPPVLDTAAPHSGGTEEGEARHPPPPPPRPATVASLTGAGSSSPTAPLPLTDRSSSPASLVLGPAAPQPPITAVPATTATATPTATSTGEAPGSGVVAGPPPLPADVLELASQSAAAAAAAAAVAAAAAAATAAAAAPSPAAPSHIRKGSSGSSAEGVVEGGDRPRLASLTSHSPGIAATPTPVVHTSVLPLAGTPPREGPRGVGTLAVGVDTSFTTLERSPVVRSTSGPFTSVPTVATPSALPPAAFTGAPASPMLTPAEMLERDLTRPSTIRGAAGAATRQLAASASSVPVSAYVVAGLGGVDVTSPVYDVEPIESPSAAIGIEVLGPATMRTTPPRPDPMHVVLTAAADRAAAAATAREDAELAAWEAELVALQDAVGELHTTVAPMLTPGRAEVPLTADVVEAAVTRLPPELPPLGYHQRVVGLVYPLSAALATVAAPTTSSSSSSSMEAQVAGLTARKEALAQGAAVSSLGLAAAQAAHSFLRSRVMAKRQDLAQVKQLLATAMREVAAVEYDITAGSGASLGAAGGHTHGRVVDDVAAEALAEYGRQAGALRAAIVAPEAADAAVGLPTVAEFMGRHAPMLARLGEEERAAAVTGERAALEGLAGEAEALAATVSARRAEAANEARVRDDMQAELSKLRAAAEENRSAQERQLSLLASSLARADGLALRSAADAPPPPGSAPSITLEELAAAALDEGPASRERRLALMVARAEAEARAEAAAAWQPLLDHMVADTEAEVADAIAAGDAAVAALQADLASGAVSASFKADAEARVNAAIAATDARGAEVRTKALHLRERIAAADASTVHARDATAASAALHGLKVTVRRLWDVQGVPHRAVAPFLADALLLAPPSEALERNLRTAKAAMAAAAAAAARASRHGTAGSVAAMTSGTLATLREQWWGASPPSPASLPAHTAVAILAHTRELLVPSSIAAGSITAPVASPPPRTRGGASAATSPAAIAAAAAALSSARFLDSASPATRAALARTVVEAGDALVREAVAAYPAAAAATIAYAPTHAALLECSATAQAAAVASAASGAAAATLAALEAAGPAPPKLPPAPPPRAAIPRAPTKGAGVTRNASASGVAAGGATGDDGIGLVEDGDDYGEDDDDDDADVAALTGGRARRRDKGAGGGKRKGAPAPAPAAAAAGRDRGRLSGIHETDDDRSSPAASQDHEYDDVPPDALRAAGVSMAGLARDVAGDGGGAHIIALGAPADGTRVRLESRARTTGIHITLSTGFLHTAGTPTHSGGGGGGGFGESGSSAAPAPAPAAAARSALHPLAGAPAAAAAPGDVAIADRYRFMDLPDRGRALLAPPGSGAAAARSGGGGGGAPSAAATALAAASAGEAGGAGLIAAARAAVAYDALLKAGGVWGDASGASVPGGTLITLALPPPPSPEAPPDAPAQPPPPAATRTIGLAPSHHPMPSPPDVPGPIPAVVSAPPSGATSGYGGGGSMQELVARGITLSRDGTGGGRGKSSTPPSMRGGGSPARSDRRAVDALERAALRSPDAARAAASHIVLTAGSGGGGALSNPAAAAAAAAATMSAAADARSSRFELDPRANYAAALLAPPSGMLPGMGALGESVMLSPPVHSHITFASPPPPGPSTTVFTGTHYNLLQRNERSLVVSPHTRVLSPARAAAAAAIARVAALPPPSFSTPVPPLRY